MLGSVNKEVDLVNKMAEGAIKILKEEFYLKFRSGLYYSKEEEKSII